MPDTQTGEHEEKRSAHIHEQQGAQPEHVSESWSPYADSPGYFQDLLGRNRLEGRGSANTRIEALKQEIIAGRIKVPSTR